MKTYTNLFVAVVSIDTLFAAWETFKKEKRRKYDVQQFEWELEKNIFQLHRDLKSKQYKHGSYSSFYITDPKQRLISKAPVRDRIVHQAVTSVLYPVFQPTFIPYSFSCQVGKGTHKGVDVVERMLRKVSVNATKPCFALKCDIRKYFASMDHDILFSLVAKRIKDQDMLWLLREIVTSFEPGSSKGLPIGNLTSQLFANVYLNELDQFLKHMLKVRYYARYTDDFVILANDQAYLESLLVTIRTFLSDTLGLDLHPHKIILKKYEQGIDFLGYVIFPHHRLLRTKTRRRMGKKMSAKIEDYQAGTLDKYAIDQTLQSYLGVLSHATMYKTSQDLINSYWLHMGKGN